MKLFKTLLGNLPSEFTGTPTKYNLENPHDPLTVKALRMIQAVRPLTPDEKLALRRGIEPDDVRTARLQRERQEAEAARSLTSTAIRAGKAKREQIAAERRAVAYEASRDAIEKATLATGFWWPRMGSVGQSRLSGRETALDRLRIVGAMIGSAFQRRAG